MKLNVKARIKDDNTLWDVEAICFREKTTTVIIKTTEEFIEYYNFKYSGGLGFPASVNNEYDLEEVGIVLSC